MPELIDAPARCVKCGATHTSSTTGKVFDRCYCGGALRPIPDSGESDALVVAACKAVGNLAAKYESVMAENARLRATLEAIIRGGYGPGSDRAHPAIELARRTIHPEQIKD